MKNENDTMERTVKWALKGMKDRNKRIFQFLSQIDDRPLNILCWCFIDESNEPAAAGYSVFEKGIKNAIHYECGEFAGDSNTTKDEALYEYLVRAVHWVTSSKDDRVITIQRCFLRKNNEMGKARI